MNAVFVSDGFLSDLTGGRHKVKGPVTMSFGDGIADDFGGGQLRFIKYTESGQPKVIATVASFSDAPKWCRDAGLDGVDAQLVGATNPNLYVEIN